MPTTPFLPEVVQKAARHVVCVDGGPTGDGGHGVLGCGVFIRPGRVATLDGLAMAGARLWTDVEVRVWHHGRAYKAQFEELGDAWHVVSLSVPEMPGGVPAPRRPSRWLRTGEDIWVVAKAPSGAVKYSQGRIEGLELCVSDRAYERHYRIVTNAPGIEDGSAAGVFDREARLIGLSEELTNGGSVIALPSERLLIGGALRAARIRLALERRGATVDQVMLELGSMEQADPEAWCVLAGLLIDRGRTTDARAALEHVVALDPENGWARRALAANTGAAHPGAHAPAPSSSRTPEPGH
jgi:hypothetical protein